MFEFENLKTKNFSLFYLNETEEAIDDLLKSSLIELDEMLKYIEINKEHYIYKNISSKYNENQKLILLLLNTSINSYGEEIYEVISFNHLEINKLMKEMFLGYENSDIIDSITKILYKTIENELKKEKFSIFKFLKNIF
jgi:hypothetical protein